MARSSTSYKPGQSGNPAGPGRVIHGLYKGRVRHCDACGTEYVARRLTSRFCSDTCRTDHGAWSFKANHASNPRVFGFTRG